MDGMINLHKSIDFQRVWNIFWGKDQLWKTMTIVLFWRRLNLLCVRLHVVSAENAVFFKRNMSKPGIKRLVSVCEVQLGSWPPAISFNLVFVPIAVIKIKKKLNVPKFNLINIFHILYNNFHVFPPSICCAIIL